MFSFSIRIAVQQIWGINKICRKISQLLNHKINPRQWKGVLSFFITVVYLCVFNTKPPAKWLSSDITMHAVYFSVCSFVHLLCIHIVCDRHFLFPLFFYLLTCTVIFHPFTKILALKWLSPSVHNMHSWRHPGKAKMLCML